MARQYIGPVIDFRIPGDVKQVVEAAAEDVGVPVDQLCREIFVDGVRQRFPNRPGSGCGKTTPPKVAISRAELAHNLPRGCCIDGGDCNCVSILDCGQGR